MDVDELLSMGKSEIGPLVSKLCSTATKEELLVEAKAKQTQLVASLEELTEELMQTMPTTDQLHSAVADCDTVLQGLEGILCDSRQQLETLMSQIRTLHDAAGSLSEQLARATTLSRLLRGGIAQRLLPIQSVEALVSGDIAAPTFQQHLTALQEVSRTMTADGPTPMYNQLMPTYTPLIEHVAGRLRAHLIPRILHLRRPRTNIAIHQQNVLCRHRSFIRFLNCVCPPVFMEVRKVYVTVLSSVYASKFQHYMNVLSKMVISVSTSDIALRIVEKAALRGGVDPIAHAAPYVIPEDRYRVVDRSLTHDTIVPHIEKTKGTRYYFEEAFHSVLGVLCDVVTHEYLFLFDFFCAAHVEILQDVFTPVVAILVGDIEKWVQSTNDHVSLLCIVCMVHRTKALMDRRRIPILHGFFDSLLLHLWPRFKVVFDKHVMSLRSVSSLDLLTVSWESTTVHPMTARYAEFVAALLRFLPMCDDLDRRLNATGAEDHSDIAPRLAMLESNIKFVCIEYDHVLLLLCTSLSNERQRNVTLLNNYFHVTSVWIRRGVSEGNPFLESLHGQLATLRTAVGQGMVELVLPNLVQVVKNNEGQNPDLIAIEACAKELFSAWKPALQSLHTHIQHCVVHPPNAVEVLKHSCMQLLLYNTRLNAVVGRYWRNPPFRAVIVSNQHMLQGMRSVSSALLGLAE